MIDYLQSNWKRVILALVLVIVGLCLLVDHLVVTEEERIVQVIAAARDAWVRQDVDGFLAHLTDDFRGTPFGQNQSAIPGLMRQYETLDATVRCSQFAFDGEDRCTFRLRVFANFADDQHGLSGRPLNFQMEVRRQGEAWRIARAEGIYRYQ